MRDKILIELCKDDAQRFVKEFDKAVNKLILRVLIFFVAPVVGVGLFLYFIGVIK